MTCVVCHTDDSEIDEVCASCGSKCCYLCMTQGFCPDCAYEYVPDDFYIKPLDFNDDPYSAFPYDPYPDEKLIDEIRAGLRE